MAAITGAQMRKIYALARERGIDADLLHIHIQMLVQKESVRELSVTEAILVIDSLEGKEKKQPGHATQKQMSYIRSLMRELQWIDADGNLEMERLDGMCKKYCHLDSHKWMTRRDASNIIEALKNMIQKLDHVC